MSKQSKIRGSFIVHGHVHGVGYRYFVWKHAVTLNLKGFAKNLFDGTVHVLAEGTEENVEALLQILRQGPSRAIVEKVETGYSVFLDEFMDFSVR